MTATTSDQLDDVVAATPEKQREQALLRLKKRRDFKTHVVAYVVIGLGARSSGWRTAPKRSPAAT